MAVDPSQLAPPGLPSGAGAPPMPGPPGVPGPPAPTAGPPAMPDPSTDPNAVVAVLQAMQAQGHAMLQQAQDQAVAQGVAEMMQQMPNPAGMDATTLGGGGAVPPTLPPDPNSAAGGAGY